MRKQRVKILPNIQRKHKIEEVELIPGLKVGMGFFRDAQSIAELLAMLSEHPKINVETDNGDIKINGISVIKKLVYYQHNM